MSAAEHISAMEKALPGLLDHLLDTAVQIATGNPAATARPGQRDLAHDMLRAAAGHIETATKQRDHAVGAAPTGSGKSLAYLSVLALMFARYGERGIISTESLTLQAQIVDKDAPTVAAAAKQVLGVDIDTRLLKGWSNYACIAKATDTAHELIGGAPAATDSDGLAGIVETVLDRPAPVVYGPGGRAARSKEARRVADERPVLIDGREYPATDLVPLVAWSLRTPGRGEAGDKHSYQGRTSDQAWDLVSVAPSDCPGVGDCPFGDVCRPQAAKRAAADADLVVTNHSMLAVQAARNVPVVVGNLQLGTFRHLVVDEAHKLPGQVRDQGARAINARRIQELTRIVEKLLGDDSGNPPYVDQIINDGLVIADTLDSHLAAAASGVTANEPVVIIDNPEANPLDGLDVMIASWAKQVKGALPDPDSGFGVKAMVAIRRAHSKVQAFTEDLVAATKPQLGHARWIEPGPIERKAFGGHARGWTLASLKTSPVDVSGALRNNLYTAPVLPDHDEDGTGGGWAGGDDERDGTDDGSGAYQAPRGRWQVPDTEWCDPGDPSENTAPRYRLSVATLSATLPNGFAREAGMSARITDYPSPFRDAYGRSVMFVPRAVDPIDVEALRSPWSTRRAKFDTKRHPEWASRHIVDLVLANAGSALVLSANREAGERYAADLRAILPTFGLHHAVHSQWDGDSLRQTIGAWRDDHGSVLVGTRSLMTGVDAPGATCSLVIVDRVPRAARNPVDDARARLLMDALDMDKWAADVLVYVSDAALLLEQAAGRLIRSEGDTGMVAVLDPRLLKTGPYAQAKPTRDAYLDALGAFGTRMSDLGQAVEWLRSRRVSTAA